MPQAGSNFPALPNIWLQISRRLCLVGPPRNCLSLRPGETLNDIGKTLQFDQLVSRLYRFGLAMVNLYAAYWGPDKVASPRHRLAHAEQLLAP